MNEIFTALRTLYLALRTSCLAPRAIYLMTNADPLSQLLVPTREDSECYELMLFV